MSPLSAGLLLVRRAPGAQLLLGHQGGPFWARREERAWSIPKGLLEPGEDVPTAARREFAEELGIAAPDVPTTELGTFRYASGKRVVVLVAEADLDLTGFAPGEFELAWPPRSGRTARFPEVDRVAWVDLADAARLLVAGQVPVLAAVTDWLTASGPPPAAPGP